MGKLSIQWGEHSESWHLTRGLGTEKEASPDFVGVFDHHLCHCPLNSHTLKGMESHQVTKEAEHRHDSKSSNSSGTGVTYNPGAY